MSRIVTLTLIAVALMAAPAMGGGYLDDFTVDFDGVSKKLNDLAEAIPADHYSWRPTEEVRTVSESLVHVAGANFFLSQALGVPMPEDFGTDAEAKITAKKDVLALLHKSQEHVRQALSKATEQDLTKELELFGEQRNRRQVFMIISGHSHEHLGQMIVYARSNKIVPPWSR